MVPLIERLYKDGLGSARRNRRDSADSNIIENDTITRGESSITRRICCRAYRRGALPVYTDFIGIREGK